MESRFFRRFPVLLQIPNDSNASERQETKDTVLPETEGAKPQMEKESSCPPRGATNKIITQGM